MTEIGMLTTMVLALLGGTVVFILVVHPKGGGGLPLRFTRSVSLGLFFGVLCATAALATPFLFAQKGNVFTTAFLLGLRMLQVLVVDDNFVDYLGNLPQGPIPAVYYCLVVAGYIALPALAALNIFDLLVRDFGNLVKLQTVHRATRRRQVYLFSEPSDVSFKLAKRALDPRRPNSKGAFVVFASMSRELRDVWGEEMEELGRRSARFLDDDYAELARDIVITSRAASLTCFALAEDTVANVGATCNLIEGLKEAHKPDAGSDSPLSDVRLYVLYGSAEDEFVLDAANAKEGPRLPLGKLRLEPMATFELFDKAPLYSVLDTSVDPHTLLRPAKAEVSQLEDRQDGTRGSDQSPAEVLEEKKLQVIVFGSGRYAEELLKEVLWRGQMVNVRLDVHVLGEHADGLESRLYAAAPGLVDERLFDLTFHKTATSATDLAAFIEKVVDSDHVYAAVAIENDERSYELAIKLRRAFFEHYAGRRLDVPTHPVIACLVRNEEISSRVEEDFDLSSNHFAIHPFGCTVDLLSFDQIIESPLERAAAMTDNFYGFYSDGTAGVPLDVNPLDIIKVRDGMAKVIGDGSGLAGDFDKTRPISEQKQIAYWSNLASAAHSRYRTWALGIDGERDFQTYVEQGIKGLHGKGPGDVGRDAEERSNPGTESLPEETIDALGRNEHDRWVVFYETQGYTYMTEDEQVRYSRTLAGDNGRQKVEPLKKHSLICANEEIWSNYLHAKSGFEYVEAGPLAPGTTTGHVVPTNGSEPLPPDLALPMQLLDGDYRVLGEFTLGSGQAPLPRLPDGDFILHPTKTVDGFECAPDEPFRVRGGELFIKNKDVSRAGKPQWVVADPPVVKFPIVKGPLVNPTAYDIAFAIISPYLVHLMDER